MGQVKGQYALSALALAAGYSLVAALGFTGLAIAALLQFTIWVD